MAVARLVAGRRRIIEHFVHPFRQHHMSLGPSTDNDLHDLANPLAFRAALQLDGVSRAPLIEQLRMMLLIRRAEEIIAEGSERRQMMTPVHLGIGQEAVAVGVAAHLRKTDRAFGAHRSHSHYLAMGGDLYRLLAEILGREDGCSRGMGGSMHLFAGEHGLLGTVPIVAGTIGLAVGAALAAKKDKQGDVAVAFFGDGAAEEGALHESLNLAAAWQLPVLFVCENNLYSSHLHISQRQPANRVARYADAHCIPSVTLDGNDIVAVSRTARELVERARAGEGPGFLEAVTYRWRGHVGHREDDDVGIDRGTSLGLWKERDPVRRLVDALVAADHMTKDELREVDAAVTAEVAEAWRRAELAAYPTPDALLSRVYSRGAR